MERLLHESLREMEANLFADVIGRLRTELPDLIDDVAAGALRPGPGPGRVPARPPLKDHSPCRMDKTYHPAAIERRIYDEWEARGYFAPAGGGDALLHHDPAAQRHRHPAHGSRLPAHAHGRADPLSPHARFPGAVAAGHRPRRHRHADGRGAAAQCRGPQAPGHRPRGSSSRGSGNGRSSPAAPSAGRCAGSAIPWTGRGTASRWTKACRRPSPRSSSACTRKA